MVFLQKPACVSIALVELGRLNSVSPHTVCAPLLTNWFSRPYLTISVLELDTDSKFQILRRVLDIDSM